LQQELETTSLDTLPRMKAAALPNPLLPTTTKSAFSSTDVSKIAVERLNPRIGLKPY